MENDPVPLLKIGGLFTVPQLGTTVNLRFEDDQYFSVQKDAEGLIQIGLAGQLMIERVAINADWAVEDIVVDLTLDNGAWTAMGEASIKAPDADLAATLAFTASAEEEPAKLAISITSGEGEDFKIFKLGVDVTRIDIAHRRQACPE